MRSDGDRSKIDELVWQALGGAFDRSVCHGIESYPYIPKECLDEIKRIISRYKETTSSKEIDSEDNEVG